MAAQPAIIPVENQDLDVTVVLPVFNEEGHLQDEVDRIGAGLRDSSPSFLAIDWEAVLLRG